MTPRRGEDKGDKKKKKLSTWRETSQEIVAKIKILQSGHGSNNGF